MKIKTFIGIMFFLLLIWGNLVSQGLEVKSCEMTAISDNSQNALAVQKALDKLTQNQIPGAVAGVLNRDGILQIWSSGYASIEEPVPMESCHLHYIQSIAKTYMAVSILQLWEEGRLDLDKTIEEYLPVSLSVQIPNASKVSIRMLLNHTSGIPEYNNDPNYVTNLLQNPQRIFEPEEYLKYIKRKKPDFEPGSKYSYRNSNYLILALIAEYITRDHQAYMQEKIFKPLGLLDTHYRIRQGNDFGQRLVQSYWDRYSNNQLENISVLQNSNVASMIGDDGIITTSKEALLFLKGLMEGKLINSKTLEMMKEPVFNSKGLPAYGLGISFTKFSGIPALGHSGGGLGSGSQLYFFPDKQLYIFLAINLGTVTESPIHVEAEKILEEIYSILLSSD
ncbi:serine hydrolase domain-containing protein [Cecembia rubra]|uniref:D-alanyl-D-alanine carboxypeptidase n=1 Tax=Cecembia rubra TaxID=1485585 RepID=A0A2P8EE19_9BACT|nr:serine hydrolase domain-containing protein [Cecembia rubra]PSL07722.1 D-alanyl-D-alanine carboxypeptidase [Cecembia rubra]